MSKYNNFEDFMQSVVNDADRKCKSRHGKSLAEAYDVSAVITKMINALIGHGWWVFIGVVALLALGPIGFGAACIAFVSTPVGMIAVGALAVFGGATAIRTLYRNRILPMAVKETGEYFKSDFNSHLNNTSYIDSLEQRASDMLLQKATRLL